MILLMQRHYQSFGLGPFHHPDLRSSWSFKRRRKGKKHRYMTLGAPGCKEPKGGRESQCTRLTYDSSAYWRPLDCPLPCPRLMDDFLSTFYAQTSGNNECAPLSLVVMHAHAHVRYLINKFVFGGKMIQFILIGRHIVYLHQQVYFLGIFLSNVIQPNSVFNLHTCFSKQLEMLLSETYLNATLMLHSFSL